MSFARNRTNQSRSHLIQSGGYIKISDIPGTENVRLQEWRTGDGELDTECGQPFAAETDPSMTGGKRYFPLTKMTLAHDFSVKTAGRR